MRGCINQISCILNSYILYDNSISSYLGRPHHYIEYYEQEKYKSYLIALDEFTKNGGLYKDLLDVHLLFCKWYDVRIKNDPHNSKKRLVKIMKDKNKLSTLFTKNKNKVIIYRNITHNNENEWNMIKKDIRELFDKTLNINNYSLLIFTSYSQKVKKFNRLYAFPVFPILGIPYKTHDGQLYSPIIQIAHDYQHIYQSLILYFDHLYNEKSSEKIDDIRIFFEKMLFLEKLNRTEESDNAQHFLWWVLHEKNFLYLMPIIDFSNDLHIKYKYLRNSIKSFFDIQLLKNILEILRYYIITQNRNVQNSYEKLFINEKNENYATTIECIKLLIQVCNETLKDDTKIALLEKIQNETINFYNRRAVYGNNNNNNNFRESLTKPHLNSISRTNFAKTALGTLTNNT